MAPRIVQVTLDLNEITASCDPDPTGQLVRAAKLEGQSGPQLNHLAEESLSGALRLTLNTDQAQALVNELSTILEG